MTDPKEVPEKIDELIEEYAMAVNGLTSYGMRETIDETKQAIIDYHDKKVADATAKSRLSGKHIRKVYEKHKHLDLINDVYFHGSVIADELWAAIKATVEDEEKAD